MPLCADRVKETTTTTGTGAITLGGAVPQFDSFSSAFSNPSVIYYCIINNTGTEWEVGIGTFTTTLSRDTVIGSSNSDTLVNFSAGTKYVFNTVPARIINLIEMLERSPGTGTIISIPANYGICVPEKFVLGSGVQLTLESDAQLAII